MSSRGERPAVFFYLGLGLVTAATLALEMIQTRLLSVVTWYHLAFFVISMAMFGMTLGALRVYLAPHKFTSESARRLLGRSALFAAIAMALAYLDQIVLAPETIVSLTTLVVFARLALTLAIPFYFSGVAVTIALTRTHYPIGRTYAADLIGAAAGVLLVLPLFSLLDGPGAVFASAAVMALGAWCFARWGGQPATGRAALAVAALMLLLAIGNAATLHGLDPILVKGSTEKRHHIAYEKWNSFSRVVALKESTRPAAEALWAPAATAPTGAREVIAMNIDGLAGTVMPKMKPDVSDGEFLLLDATAMAYAIRHGDVAVIGVGGGKDMLTALAAGNERVLGVELNPVFIDLLQNRYRDYTHLADQPGVRLVVDEARSYFTRTDEQFDLIQASLIDTWAATGAGAFSLSENAIYTVEAWQVFLARLKPAGVFTVSRWYAPGRLDETVRLVSLAVAALFVDGAEQPGRHLLLGAHDQVATLLVSRQPFSADDIAAFKAMVAERGFELLLAPGEPTTEKILGLVRDAADPAALWALTSSYELDVTPPTDNRPFFFNLLRLTRPWEILSYMGRPSGVVTGNLMATLTLLAILLVTVVFGAAIVYLPTRFAPPGASLPRAVELAYFILIGLGFMFVEIAFLQRLSVYLGHPVYALAVVLFSLIFFTGLGSLISERVRLDTAARLALYAVTLAGYLGFVAWLLPQVTAATAAAQLPGRAGLSLALLAPAGLLMGLAFPNGMRLARRGDTDPTPWLWGVNGAAGVLASALAVILSIAFGITTTMVVGATCYLALAALGPRLTR